MESVHILTFAVLLLGVVLAYLGLETLPPLNKKLSSFGRYHLPPGPNGKPIVGNMLDFWQQRKSGTLAATWLGYRKQYEEMTTLRMGSTLWVLLNTNRVTSEIIHKRAKFTHERPPMPISGGIVSRGMRSVTQHTHKWSELRRLMRPLLNDTWTKTFIDWQDFESKLMLDEYLKAPEKWYLHNSRYATGAIYGTLSGKRLGKTEEEMGLYRRTTMEFLGSIQNTVVDFFPFLERVPRRLQFWRGKWKVMGERHAKVFRSWWDGINLDEKNQERTNTNRSWVQEILLNPETQFKGTEEEGLYLTNTLISAGGDNPRIALNTCLMASILHPSALGKCRTEIDQLCGTSRLPTAADISSLLYTCAFIKEVLRWRPVVPQIPPHTAAEDFTFEGYIFPKGTSFIINVPAVSRDYEDAESFKPERWMDGKGGEEKLTQDFWGFGGGKRICIGYKAALPAVLVPFARLVWGFEAEKADEFDDRKVNSWSAGEPFPLRVRSRGREYEQVILRECSLVAK